MWERYQNERTEIVQEYRREFASFSKKTHNHDIIFIKKPKEPSVQFISFSKKLSVKIVDIYIGFKDIIQEHPDLIGLKESAKVATAAAFSDWISRRSEFAGLISMGMTVLYGVVASYNYEHAKVIYRICQGILRFNKINQ